VAEHDDMLAVGFLAGRLEPQSKQRHEEHLR